MFDSKNGFLLLPPFSPPTNTLAETIQPFTSSTQAKMITLTMDFRGISESAKVQSISIYSNSLSTLSYAHDRKLQDPSRVLAKISISSHVSLLIFSLIEESGLLERKLDQGILSSFSCNETFSVLRQRIEKRKKNRSELVLQKQSSVYFFIR